MSEQPGLRRRRNRGVAFVVGALLLVAACLGGWMWWTVREQAQAAAHRGLEGVWVDDTGQDISYQFRKDGKFLVRQKLPGNLAPFSGDPGVEHRPRGEWGRDGQSVSVKAEPHWGFDLVLGEDGVLRGEYFLDQWSGQGEYSQSRKPVVLTRKADAP